MSEGFVSSKPYPKTPLKIPSFVCQLFFKKGGLIQPPPLIKTMVNVRFEKENIFPSYMYSNTQYIHSAAHGACIGW